MPGAGMPETGAEHEWAVPTSPLLVHDGQNRCEPRASRRRGVPATPAPGPDTQSRNAGTRGERGIRADLLFLSGPWGAAGASGEDVRNGESAEMQWDQELWDRTTSVDKGRGEVQRMAGRGPC